jgi:hypothetical protein
LGSSHFFIHFASTQFIAISDNSGKSSLKLYKLSTGIDSLFSGIKFIVSCIIDKSSLFVIDSSNSLLKSKLVSIDISKISFVSAVNFHDSINLFNTEFSGLFISFSEVNFS